MSNKFLSFIAILSILFAVFMAWQKYEKDQENLIPIQSSQENIKKQEVFNADAVIVGFGNNSIILDIDGQRRTGAIDDTVQIYAYKPKTEEALAKELQNAVEQGLTPPDSGEYIVKTKNDLLPYAKVSVETQNDISQPGDLILYKIVIK